MRIIRPPTPGNLVDFLINFQTLQVIKLGLMRLELCVKPVLAILLLLAPFIMNTRSREERKGIPSDFAETELLAPPGPPTPKSLRFGQTLRSKSNPLYRLNKSSCTPNRIPSATSSVSVLSPKHCENFHTPLSSPFAPAICIHSGHYIKPFTCRYPSTAWVQGKCARAACNGQPRVRALENKLQLLFLFRFNGEL